MITVSITPFRIVVRDVDPARGRSRSTLYGALSICHFSIESSPSSPIAFSLDSIESPMYIICAKRAFRTARLPHWRTQKEEYDDRVLFPAPRRIVLDISLRVRFDRYLRTLAISSSPSDNFLIAITYINNYMLFVIIGGNYCQTLRIDNILFK